MPHTATLHPAQPQFCETGRRARDVGCSQTITIYAITKGQETSVAARLISWLYAAPTSGEAETTLATSDANKRETPM